MCARIQLQRHAIRSPILDTDVFEQASVSILRRFQRAARPAPAIGSDGASPPTCPATSPQAQQQDRIASTPYCPNSSLSP